VLPALFGTRGKYSLQRHGHKAPFWLQASATAADVSFATEQLVALQGVIETQAQDRSASITVIEQLQDEVAQAHDRQRDLEQLCAVLENKCEAAEGAAANPGPAFVSVEELVAERGASADARGESDRLRVRVDELQAELNVARSRIKTLVRFHC
jgi:hypothetical protein